MPIIKSDKDYFENIINKTEICLIDLLELEDFDRRKGKLENLEDKVNKLSFIISDFLENTPEGIKYIKKYVENTYVNGITYEEPVDDPR